MITSPRRVANVVLLVLLLAGLTSTVFTQSATLRVIESGPTGPLRQIEDANEIRVVFSEPMVSLGRIPSNPSPSWMHIAPDLKGEYRWSGTTTLIFTPDPTTPVPHATRYVVTVDAAASSAAGRRLAAPVQFTFTTPTVRLTSVRWARQTPRFDSLVAIVLEFDQAVRPADVVAHTTARYQAHDWTAPTFTADERARLNASDAAGLRLFDAKVAATRRAVAATAAVPLRAAVNWDRTRFKPSDQQVVLETQAPPPPDSWLQITVDARMPSLGGSALPTQPQSSTVELAPTLFVTGPHCKTACEPSGFSGIEFTQDVAAGAFAPTLTIRDVTAAGREQTVAKKTTTQGGGRHDVSRQLGLEDAGFDHQPALTTWLHRIDASLQSVDGQTLGYPWIGLVETWHDQAFTGFGDGHGVWEKGGGTQLPFYARNFTNVTQWLTPISLADLVPRIVALEKKHFEEPPPGGGTERRLGGEADAVLSHGLDLAKVLSPKGTGLVWAMVAPGQPIPKSKAAGHDARSTMVQVTNLGVTVKDSPQSTLLFVTRLDNGEPVPDARVSLLSLANKVLWRGKTNRDGLALAPRLGLRKAGGYGGDEEGDSVEGSRDFSYVATAEKDGDIAYVASDWKEGIEPWDFGVNYDLWQATDMLRGSIFTDRGLYRPGEQVHFKAIVRADTPTGIRLLPSGTLLDIRVHDSRNRLLDSRSIKVNKWSGVDWTWEVPADGSIGSYSVTAWMHGAAPAPDRGNDTSGRRIRRGEWLKRIDSSFTVAAYRRADFRVAATLTAQTPIAGTSMRATVDGHYLFGNAMAKRSVRWRLDRARSRSVPSAIGASATWNSYAFGYWRENARPQETRVAGETVALDANGALSLDLPAASDVDFPYLYTFQGEVEDLSRQRLADSVSLLVYPASVFVGLHLPDYFADVAKGAMVDVAVVDLSGAAVPRATVTLTLNRVNWNSVRRAEGSGFYTWDTERVVTPAGQWTVQSGATPTILPIPLTEGGYYELTAVTRDAEGRATRTDVSFYGLGKGYTAWERYDHNRITLKPEHDRWKPGEKARVMIQSPWESATALLTVEREGIRHYERFALTSTQQTVEIPITEADIPNLYVSVLLIRGRTSQDIGTDGNDPGKPAFRLGYTELAIEDASKKLAVDVAADRPQYRPANTAKVSVSVKDAAGRPAKGEVTLWAVDYGVLSLIGYDVPDIVRSVYEHKALQVATVDNRQRIISRRVLTPKGAGEGGGGGAEAGAGGLRKDFRPLAFWLGSVETDGNGRASTDVKLPDSVTTYHIMAVASDQQSRFGSAKPAEIIVNKPLMLVPAFPRFLTLGDKASFGASLTNTLPAGGSAVVTVKSLDPAVLSFENGSQTVTMAAGTTDAIRFSATARSIGIARVQMTAALGANNDAFEVTLPVSVITPVQTQATTGEVADRSTQPVAVPPGVIAQTGGLQIDLASTALVGLGEGVRYVTDYPFGCAEQKTSRAFVLWLAADLGNVFPMGRVTPADYRKEAATVLRDLSNYQCPDGGFTLWPGRCSATNAYLTAYVLHMFKTVGTLGATPDPAVVKSALDFLEREQKAGPPAPNQIQFLPIWSASTAFGAKVLAEYGRNQDANITRLVGFRDQLPLFALSYVADALATANDRGPRYQDVVRRISNALRVEGDQAHAEEGNLDVLGWVWASNSTTTAIVLEGFVRRGDDAVNVPRMARWLLTVRRNGRWGNTHENARALESLVAYYRKYEAETPNFDATAALGTKTIGTAAFRGRTSVAQTIQVSMRDLIAASTPPADLVLTRTGSGRMFFASRLQFASTEPLPASDQGIHVERRYETYVENGDGPVGTTFAAGDLVRITLTVTLPKERRFVALTDPLPAGFEAVDGWFRTTAADVAREAERADNQETGDWWRRGGFDRIEKYDDRVQLFATRLADGRHEFSYLVRATTSGTFRSAGSWAEEMYSPEVNGRSAPVMIEIK